MKIPTVTRITFSRNLKQARKWLLSVHDSFTFKSNNRQGGDSRSILSADCAEAFAQCESALLTLHGLEDLSEKAVEELSRSNEGSLHLKSLKTPSGEAAAALSRFNGLRLFIGLNVVTDEAALALRQFPGSLTLTDVKSISESAAKVLSERKQFKCYSGRLRDQAFETLPAATADLLRKP